MMYDYNFYDNALKRLFLFFITDAKTFKYS